MLTKKTIETMATFFFGGEPEKAYELFSDCNEWSQFQKSITYEDSFLSYLIMRNSDMTVWHEDCEIVPGKETEGYEVDYIVAPEVLEKFAPYIEAHQRASL